MAQLIDNKTGKIKIIEPSYRLHVEKSNVKSGSNWLKQDRMDSITKAPSYKLNVVKQNDTEG